MELDGWDRAGGQSRIPHAGMRDLSDSFRSERLVQTAALASHLITRL